MAANRRIDYRVPESRLITEFHRNAAGVASTVNLSKSGLYLVKPYFMGPLGPRQVQLEIPVPEAGDSIWATGQVVFEAIGKQQVGTGIRFVDMARFHRGLLRDIIEIRRAELKSRMMRELRWKKLVSYQGAPCFAPPPAPRRSASEHVLMG